MISKVAEREENTTVHCIGLLKAAHCCTALLGLEIYPTDLVEIHVGLNEFFLPKPEFVGAKDSGHQIQSMHGWRGSSFFLRCSRVSVCRDVAPGGFLRQDCYVHDGQTLALRQTKAQQGLYHLEYEFEKLHFDISTHCTVMFLLNSS